MFHAPAPSNARKSVPAIYQSHKNEKNGVTMQGFSKWRNTRVKGSFTPLVFSTSGGMCGEVRKGSFTPLVFLTSGGMCGEVEKGSFTPLVS